MTFDLTTLGFKSPQSNEHTRLWEHFKGLADSVQAEYDSRPFAYLYRTTGQSIATGAGVYTNADYDGAFGRAANIDLVNNRILVDRSGYYRIDSSVAWSLLAGAGARAMLIMQRDASAATDLTLCQVTWNGTDVTTTTNPQRAVAFAPADPGDYFYLKFSQTQGTAQNVGGGQALNYLVANWLRPL